MVKFDKAATEALHDLQSHARVWRSLLNEALDKAVVLPPDIDDRSYWLHEIAVLDRVVAVLGQIDAHVEE